MSMGFALAVLFFAVLFFAVLFVAAVVFFAVLFYKWHELFDCGYYAFLFG